MATLRKVLKQGRAAESVSRDMAALPDLSLDDLKARWRQLYSAPPPARLGRTLLMRGLAHRMQERALGGLKAATLRRLDQAAKNIAAGLTLSAAPTALKPGTRLLRDWQGITHEVILLEDGVRYRGRTWRSLSAVAREITGTQWSGPLFFGLTNRRDSR